MLLVIDYQQENGIVVKVTSPGVYMLWLARVTLVLGHATTLALLHCFSLRLRHVLISRQ